MDNNKKIEDLMNFVYPQGVQIPYRPEEVDPADPISALSPQTVGSISPNGQETNGDEFLPQQQPTSTSPESAKKEQLKKLIASKVSVPSSSTTAPQSKDFRDDILKQFQDMRAKNQAELADARQRDDRIALLNSLNKSFNQIGTGIANRGGFTNIKSSPLEVASDEAKQAMLTGQENLKGLEQQYGILSDKEKAALAGEDRAFERDYKNRMLRLEEMKLAEAKKKENGENKLSEGQKAVDKGYAKAYNDFTGGGESRANNAIKKLKELRNEVEKESKSVIQAGGGTIAGSLPDWARTTRSVSLRDNAISVANQGLKATFGAQLSDSEREAAAKEFYNDKLPPAENLKVMDRKIKELEDSLNDEKTKAKYFQKNETLSGFSPSASSNQEVQSTAPYGDTVERNGKTYKWNPTVGKYQPI